MTEVQPTEFSADVAYGRTPESALYAVLAQNPTFNLRDPEYIGEKPAFMDVKTHQFHLHDWDQYDEKTSPVPGKPNDPPYITSRYAVDIVPENNETRKRLTISNVWVNVGRGEWDSGERTKAKFKFSIQMRKSAWEDVDEPRMGDLQWYCELMATDPIGETWADQ